MTALVIALLSLASGALREPPARVKYPAERKGEVTFDHAAHLSRREKCKTCHGDGPVQKIQMTKKHAHSLCLGCHASKRKGPVACSGCHDIE